MLRTTFLEKIRQKFRVNPIVAILGPRQCGKTTLAREFTHNNLPRQNYFDLENPEDLQRLTEAKLSLENLTGLVIIDEIQRRRELFPILRVLVDRPNQNTQFLILGSASRELIQQSSESLAGRISYLELTPFSFAETHELSQLWLRGGFPKSYLAENDEISYLWRKDYIRSFLEQDIPNLGINVPAENLRRFWLMLTQYHGNIFNASEMGRAMGFSHTTIKNYMDILTGTFMIRQLQPWFENINKRQVKSPKIYFRDSGIIHALLNINDQEHLYLTPRLGALWEGFALEEIIRKLNSENADYYFWATHNQAEIDLLVFKGNRRYGFEFKYSSSPKMTNSIKIALTDLHLDKVFIIFPGDTQFLLATNVLACGLKTFLESASIS